MEFIQVLQGRHWMMKIQIITLFLLNRVLFVPGTVYADPYGHTLILIGRVQQTSDQPGILLSVDAQPDGTVGIKRFWKGNFLFNTSGVVGEPGFKAFRPISCN